MLRYLSQWWGQKKGNDLLVGLFLLAVRLGRLRLEKEFVCRVFG